MLIIPLEDRPDWKRPPVLCALLVLVNITVFLLTEANDRQVEADLDAGLDAAMLAEHEWPLLLEHTREQDRRLWSRMRGASEHEREFLLWRHAWLNREFDRVVAQHWQAQPPDQDWRQAREFLEAQRDRLSWYRWGLTPAEPRALTFLTALFVHGDLMHLVGNMVFLLLLGMPMEKRWGRLPLLGMYLLAGLAGDAAHIVVFPDSHVPLVGASGAISGLMGIYAATYGLRRIEFFYSVIFLFGSLRAPALWILPVWFGWELVQHFRGDAGVAYLAHAGGIAGGFALALALRHGPGERTMIAEEPPEPEIAPSAVPARLTRLVEQLEFDKALKACRDQLEAEPDNEPLWLFRMETAGKYHDRALDETLSDALRALHGKRIGERLATILWSEYRRLGGDDRRLAPPLRLLAAELCLRQGDEGEAARIVQEIQKHSDWRHPRLERLHELLDGC